MKDKDGTLYPELPLTVTQADAPVQQFRLQKISELEAFLQSEIEKRERLRKKYRVVVNILDGTCGGLGLACVGMGVSGTVMLSTGIGLVPGIILEGATVVVGFLDIAGIAISRRCSAKAAKHEAVRVLAVSKLNTVHRHISKALEDCKISDAEYKLVLDEVEKFRVLKEDLHRKHAPAAGSVIDQETRNALIQRGREEARASFIKKLGVSESP